MVVNASGAILSWKVIYDLSGEDDELRKVVSLLQAGVKDRESWAPVLPWFASHGAWRYGGG